VIGAYGLAASFVVLVVVLAQLPFATARLARLIPRDSIGSSIRSMVRKKYGEHSVRADFITCHWCQGVWAAILTNLFGWGVISLTGLMPVWMCALLMLISIPATAYQASRMIDREDG